MMNQPEPNRKSQGTARLIAIIAVVTLAATAIVGWKMGWFGTTSPTSAEAGGGADRVNPGLATPNIDVKQQKIDAALDAAGQYVNTDKLGEAEKILEALLADNPRNRDLLRQIYESRLFQKDYPKAYTAIRALLENGSTDPDQFFNAGTIAFELENYTQAEAHYQQAALLDTRRVAVNKQAHPDSTASLNPKYPLYLAQTQIKIHQYEDAKIQLLKVLQIDPSVHEAFGTMAEIALIQNKLDIAAQNVARARQIAPNFLLWRILDAKIIRRQNDPKEALQRLNAITAPNFHLRTDVVDEKAKCWAMLGQPEKAAQQYVDQLNTFPDAWLSAVRASEYFSIAGNDTQAQLWYFYARERAPEGTQAVTDLAKRFPATDSGGG